jgi:hypothetical protein|tara:strand:- start:812 stop:1057 length:246 start_codon:yes stop_codon:yes gene_type:complete
VRCGVYTILNLQNALRRYEEPSGMGDGTVVIAAPHDVFTEMWWREATVDHIIPLSHHGSNKKKNLQLMCRACNMMKGAKLE